MGRFAVFFKISIWIEDDDRTRFECRRQQGDAVGFSGFWTLLEDQAYRDFTNARGARCDADDEFGDDNAMAQHQKTESAQLSDIVSSFETKSRNSLISQIEKIEAAQREHATQSAGKAHPKARPSMDIGSVQDDRETKPQNASRSRSSRQSRQLDDDDDLQHGLKQRGNDEESAGDGSTDSDCKEIDQHPHQELSHAELLEIEAGMNIMAQIQESEAAQRLYAAQSAGKQHRKARQSLDIGSVQDDRKMEPRDASRHIMRSRASRESRQLDDGYIEYGMKQDSDEEMYEPMYQPTSIWEREVEARESREAIQGENVEEA